MMPVSNRPMGTATIRPTATLTGKTHIRETGASCRDIRTPATRAAIPGTRKYIVETPSGGTTPRLMMKGTAETATSIITIPLTV